MTSSEITHTVWEHLSQSPLKSTITGGLYKVKRPANSTKEDGVVNCLGAPNTQLQKSIVNLNLFVPDKTVTIGGQTQKQPNVERLKTLEALAIAYLTGERYPGYWFDYQQSSLLEDEGQHFINIRIAFYALNF